MSNAPRSADDSASEPPADPAAARDAWLHLATASSNTGLWDWDIASNRVSYSSIWKRQLGYEDHELEPTYDTWASRVHPADLDDAVAVLEEAVATGGAFEYEVRMRHRDGSYRWLLSRASIVRDAHGRAERALGSHVDITERRQLERDVLDAAERGRAELARRLHEELAQQLAGLQLMLQGSPHAPAPLPVAERAQAARLARDVIGSVRALARDLSPLSIDPRDLPTLVRQLARERTGTGEPAVTVLCGEDVQALVDSATALQVYRLAHDAVADLVRAAGVTAIVVTVELDAGGLRLEIDGAGAGLNVDSVIAPQALRLLRYRAHLLGGRITLAVREDGVRLSCRTEVSAA